MEILYSRKEIIILEKIEIILFKQTKHLMSNNEYKEKGKKKGECYNHLLWGMRYIAKLWGDVSMEMQNLGRGDTCRDFLKEGF